MSDEADAGSVFGAVPCLGSCEILHEFFNDVAQITSLLREAFGEILQFG